MTDPQTEILVTIRERLAVIESKVDAATIERVRVFADLETRVRALEGFRFKLLGAVAAGGAMGGVIGSLLTFALSFLL